MMNQVDTIELFVLKCASLKIAVDKLSPRNDMILQAITLDKQIQNSIDQFSTKIRFAADHMSEFYKLFYMLENDIRKMIDDTISETHGAGWWDEHVPNSAKEECRLNQQREAEYGVTNRSDRELDYISFGQLGDIIRHNWILFGGIVSNQKALGRVMHALNNLRGPIAHCGVLADDEIERLKLTVKDWFRLLEGPK